MSAGREVTSIGKSVFFWTQRGFEYGNGDEFRDSNSTCREKGILKVGEIVATVEQRGVMGIIAIHVGDLLISGSGVFIKYISKMSKGDSIRIAMGKTKRPIWVWQSENQTMRSSDA